LRLLFVSPQSPWPARTGTSVIALNQIRGLSTRFEIDLVSLTSADGGQDPGPLRDLCRSVVLVTRPGKLRGMAQRGIGISWGRPWEVSRFASRAMRRAVAAALADRPDVTLFQLTESVQFRPGHDDTPSVWSMEDPAVLKAERMLPWAPAYQRPLLRARADLLRRYEERRIDRFSRILLINRGDLADYRAVHPHGRFAWVPYGISVEPGDAPPLEARRPGRIVISGNMHHPPNARGIAFFLEHVFPRVRRDVEGAHLVLVGARPPRWMQALSRDAPVEVTGFVPDVRPHLRDAVVSMCAVDLKVGTQTKVLEALAEGTPVVTTSAGNHGIEGRDGLDLHVADGAETMAAKVTSLLRGERWAELSREGRRLAREFSWENAVGRLDDVLREVAAERRRSP
jgi:hypothetical protein